MEYKLLTGFSIQDYNVIFNILSISHDNIKILPLKYCSTIILTTNAQFWEFKYNENTKKSTEFNNKADDEKKEERRQGRNRGKERREQREKKRSGKKNKKRGLERRKEGREHFFLMGNYMSILSHTVWGRFVYSRIKKLLTEWFLYARHCSRITKYGNKL